MNPRRAVMLIVLAELLGTSLWFSGNNAVRELSGQLQLSSVSKAWLVMAVQIGFVVGTALSAVTALSDRIRAHRLFAVSAIIGAAANLGFAAMPNDLFVVIVLRFLTGIALAGIYPVGMKLVISWAPDRAGSALGWLVGALTVGTALPFFARFVGADWWREAVAASSAAALVGAVLVGLVGEGPTQRRSAPFRFGAMRALTAIRNLRASALGYFGHMWELYAFWALVPFLVGSLGYEGRSLWLISFWVVAIGGVGCVAGGRWAVRVGGKRVAIASMAISGCCCIVAAALPELGAVGGVLLLLVWGFSAVADSPQFSAMSAQAAPADSVGSVLTAQNCLGFLLTLGSIQLAIALSETIGRWTPLILAPGPLLGLLALRVHGRG